MKEEELVFIETTSANLYDRMDAEYLHPERINTVKKLRSLEKQGLLELKKLSEFFIVGKSKTDASPDTILPCIEMKDVDVDYGLMNVRKVAVGDAGTSLTKCEGGQILFSRLRPYLNKVILIPPHIKEAICSGEFFVLKPRRKGLPLGYLWITLRSEFVLNQSRHLIGGAMRPRIDDTEIVDIEVPVLTDDKTVSQIDADVVEAVSKFYPAQADLMLAGSEFLRATGLPPAPALPNLFFGFSERQPDAPRDFYRMDPLFFHPSYYVDLKKVLDGWAKRTDGSVMKLADLCEKGGIARRKAKVKSEEGETPRLGVENITGNGILWDCLHVEVAAGQASKFLRRDDILITSTGTGSTGRCDIFTEDVPAITDGHITIVRLKNGSNHYYVLTYLKTEYAKRQLARMEKGSSGQIEMYPEDIGNLLVPIPSDDKVTERAQKKVREATEQMQASKSALNKSRKLLSFLISKAPIDEGNQPPDTAIPHARWRIVRP